VTSHPETERAVRAEAARESAYTRSQRAVALAYGIACHALFAVAIAAMIYSIDQGLTWGVGPFEGAAAWTANLLLVGQFPLLHSWLLSRRDRNFLSRLAPLGLGRDLAATNFAAISSLRRRDSLRDSVAAGSRS